ncbi:MAG: hypothetical protein ABI759_23770 [Candidatus Solibacter sp.]
MSLTRVDKERIRDSRLKLQTVARSLKEVNPSEVNGMEEIQECLEDAEKSLKGALKKEDLE